MFTNKTTKIFSPDVLQAIAEVIHEAELTTSGEVRVVVRSRRSLWEHRLSVQELAVKEFHRLGMDRTRDRSGVIIFILFSEHKFSITADQGINELVEQKTWDDIAAAMSHAFHAGRYRDGVIDAVKSIEQILSQYFPRKDDDANELPNHVILR